MCEECGDCKLKIAKTGTANTASVSDSPELAGYKPIFSGDYSKDMWDAINKANSKRDLREALYFVCCRLQELETKLEKAGL